MTYYTMYNFLLDFKLLDLFELNIKTHRTITTLVGDVQVGVDGEIAESRS